MDANFSNCVTELCVNSTKCPKSHEPVRLRPSFTSLGLSPSLEVPLTGVWPFQTVFQGVRGWNIYLGDRTPLVVSSVADDDACVLKRWGGIVIPDRCSHSAGARWAGTCRKFAAGSFFKPHTWDMGIIISIKFYWDYEVLAITLQLHIPLNLHYCMRVDLNNFAWLCEEIQCWYTGSVCQIFWEFSFIAPYGVYISNLSI